MKNYLAVLILIIAFQAYSQTEITLEGNPTDSTLIKRKITLESKGFIVKILPTDEMEPGDEDFIKKYTNSSLPSFELTDIEGIPISSEELAGKKVHINFWSTTCKPCIEEFPELNSLRKKYESDDILFIAFAPEPKNKVLKVIKKHPLNYRVIANAKDFYKELGINGYPKNFFIDKTGKIVKVTDGTNYKSELKKGKLVLVPDNFDIYDQILKDL